MADAIYLYDLSELGQLDLKNDFPVHKAYATVHFVVTLQGIVNRKKPRLFLNCIHDPRLGGTVDRFWLDWLCRKGNWLYGRKIVPIHDLEELVATFRRQLNGLTLYNLACPVSSNVASTLAGLEDAPALLCSPRTNNLQDLLLRKKKLAVRTRLFDKEGNQVYARAGRIAGSTRPASGSAKNDAYRWLLDNRFRKGSGRLAHFGYYLDAWWLQHHRNKGCFWHHDLLNHDFFVSRQGLIFDLSPWADEPPVDDPHQPSGTDFATLQEILREAYEKVGQERMIHVGGFVPWLFKYTRYTGGRHGDVESEWHYARLLSAHNAYMDADAYGDDPMANASFFQHFPLKKQYRQPNRPPTLAALKKSKLLDGKGKVASRCFVSFYVGDYDSAAWLYRGIPHLWQDPVRGKIPLGWAFNPSLEIRMGPALAYARENASKNDFFVAGDSGAGYVNPGMFQEPRGISGLPSGLDVWAKHCIPFYRRWDLSITGFVIDGHAPGLNAEGFRCYRKFSPDGIAVQKAPSSPGVAEGIPTIILNEHIQGFNEEADIEQIAEVILRESRERPGPHFLYYRTVCKSPSFHQKIMKAVCAKNRKSRIQFVDPFAFFALIRQWAAVKPRILFGATPRFPRTQSGIRSTMTEDSR